jgi:hypothetical protein
MTPFQQRQIEHLRQTGWQVALDAGDHVDLIHVTASHGAFAVARVHPTGGYSWEGSYPLEQLSNRYPTLGRPAA